MDTMYRVMDAITDMQRSRSVPLLEIDGRWNKQRTQKLVNQILDNKNQQFYIDITEEEITEKFKKYWMDILMTAYNNIDKLTAKKEEK